jgi:hypothetical protein
MMVVLFWHQIHNSHDGKVTTGSYLVTYSQWVSWKLVINVYTSWIKGQTHTAHQHGFLKKSQQSSETLKWDFLWMTKNRFTDIDISMWTYHPSKMLWHARKAYIWNLILSHLKALLDHTISCTCHSSFAYISHKVQFPGTVQLTTNATAIL